MATDKITLADLEARGAELSDDRLGRIFGGLPKGGGAEPTIDTVHGNYDAPGTAHLTNGHDI